MQTCQPQPSWLQLSQDLTKQRNLVDFFFNEHDGQGGGGDTLWRCMKCQQDKKKSGGWTNLLAHLKACIGPE
mgnify:CR=1 FL=1